MRSVHLRALQRLQRVELQDHVQLTHGSGAADTGSTARATAARPYVTGMPRRLTRSSTAAGASPARHASSQVIGVSAAEFTATANV